MDWIVKYWIEWIFGVLAAVLLYLFRKLNQRMKDSQKKNEAVELGVQALLRAQMIADYNYYAEKGWAPVYARDNFENCWMRYEALGENNVMKDIHDKFLALPVKKPKDAPESET